MLTNAAVTLALRETCVTFLSTDTWVACTASSCATLLYIAYVYIINVLVYAKDVKYQPAVSELQQAFYNKRLVEITFSKSGSIYDGHWATQLTC